MIGIARRVIFVASVLPFLLDAVFFLPDFKIFVLLLVTFFWNDYTFWEAFTKKRVFQTTFHDYTETPQIQTNWSWDLFGFRFVWISGKIHWYDGERLIWGVESDVNDLNWWKWLGAASLLLFGVHVLKIEFRSVPPSKLHPSYPQYFTQLHVCCSTLLAARCHCLSLICKLFVFVMSFCFLINNFLFHCMLNNFKFS